MDKELEGVEVTTITMNDEEVKKMALECGVDEETIRDFLSGKIDILELPS